MWKVPPPKKKNEFWSTKECSHHNMKQITNRKLTKKCTPLWRGILQSRELFLHSVSLISILLALILSYIYFFFLFNVQVSLPTIYLHLSILPTASKVTPAATNIQLANSTAPIFVIVLLIIVPTSTSHISGFPNFSGCRALPFYIGSVKWIINCVFFQCILKFLVQQVRNSG